MRRWLVTTICTALWCGLMVSMSMAQQSQSLGTTESGVDPGESASAPEAPIMGWGRPVREGLASASIGESFVYAVAIIRSNETNEALKQEARKVITHVLRGCFDMDQTNRRREIIALERQLAQLREQLEKREDAKERLVELRILLLENESTGVGFPRQWRQLPGIGGGPEHGSDREVGMDGAAEPQPERDLTGSPLRGGSAVDGPGDFAATNLKEIAVSLQYHSEMVVKNVLPAAYSTDSEGRPLLSWRVHLLWLLGHTDLYAEFRLGEPWDSKHNQQLIKKMPDIFRSSGNAPEDGRTRFLGNAGKQGVFVAPLGNRSMIMSPPGMPLTDISDGTANTIMVVEASEEAAVIWTKPEDFAFEEHDDLWQSLAGQDGDRFLAVMCDGSVKTVVKAAVELPTLKAMFTRSGGETIADVTTGP